MFRLVAPANAPVTTTLLPSPEFSDSENLRATVTVRRTIDGSMYTFVKRRQKSKSYLWDFNLTRNKSWELLEFYQSYNDEEVIAYWNDLSFKGYFKNNPFEAATQGADLSDLGGDYVKVTIELEERG